MQGRGVHSPIGSSTGRVYAFYMNKVLLGTVVLIIIIIGVWYVYLQTTAPVTVGGEEQTLGTYTYECDEHVVFTMTPSLDVASIKIEAAAGGVYPPTLTLTRVESASGARYEAGAFSFFGQGESVRLAEGDQALNCSPVPKQGEAPFNWGD